jgi:hypothetical protein
MFSSCDVILCVLGDLYKPFLAGYTQDISTKQSIR